MKNDYPLVSFLMPVYNGEKTVARAIESMLNQTYANIEIVIIDDCSVDDTHEICLGYAKNNNCIRVYKNNTNMGVAKSLNRGLCLCEGKYIARMDADDFSMSDRVETQVCYMETYPNIGVLGCNMMIATDFCDEISEVKYAVDNQHLKCTLLFNTPFSHPTVMLRTEVLRCSNIQYPEKYAEDYALWTEMSFITDFATIPEVFLKYSVSDDNVTSSNFSKIRNDSAEISRYAIQKHLNIDVSNYSDIHFGWCEYDGVPYDICEFLQRSSQLLKEIKEANTKQGIFNPEILHEVLIKQWKSSKRIALMSVLSDNYEEFSKAEYSKAVETFRLFNNSTRVVIYSVGRATEHVLSKLGGSFPFTIVGFVDADKNKHGTVYNGMKVLPPEDLSGLPYDYVLIGSTLHFNEIKRYLVDDLSIKEEQLLDLAITNDFVFHSQREQFAVRLVEAMKSGKSVAFLFCAPDYGNLGDHAIAAAEQRFFKELGYELIEIPLHKRKDFDEIVRHHIRKEDLILITGGGFLGSLWLGGERPARKIVEDYPDNRIIILPQTVYWDDDVGAKRDLKLTQEVYAQHKNLTLFARDKTTYEQVRVFYPDTKILLAPDMALYDDWSGYYSCDGIRNGALLCLKFDKESILSEEQKVILAGVAEKIGLQVRHRSTDSSQHIWMDERTEPLKDLLQDFRNAELVITDRLHGFIFAAVTGTPCVALGAYTHKLHATFEWIAHLPYMRFAESLDCVEELAREVLEVGGGIYDNSPLIKYYNELSEEILIRKPDSLRNRRSKCP